MSLFYPDDITDAQKHALQQLDIPPSLKISDDANLIYALALAFSHELLSPFDPQHISRTIYFHIRTLHTSMFEGCIDDATAYEKLDEIIRLYDFYNEVGQILNVAVVTQFITFVLYYKYLKLILKDACRMRRVCYEITYGKIYQIQASQRRAFKSTTSIIPLHEGGKSYTNIDEYLEYLEM